MPSGLVMAEAMLDRCVASATKWRNAASISDGSSSCGHRSCTLNASVSCKSSRWLEAEVVAMTSSLRFSSSGAFFSRTNNVCSTDENRGPTGVYSMSRSASSITIIDSGDL